MANMAKIIPKRPKIRFWEKVGNTWLTIPKAGKIKIYTSGCPKNQNKCWYKIGSPPPAGSKKLVPTKRSVNNIVNPAANTGKDKTNNQAVIKIAHTNKGNLSKVNPGDLMFIMVTIRLMAPYKEETPAICKLKIDKSTAAPKW